jgi:hypothetical protein
MSRLARAIEILESINDFFQEHDGQTVLYSDSQILEGDISIKDAVAECVGMEDKKDEPVVPLSKQRRIWKNQWDNWNGYIGKRRVKQFGLDESAARAWLWENENVYD